MRLYSILPHSWRGVSETWPGRGRASHSEYSCGQPEARGAVLGAKGLAPPLTWRVGRGGREVLLLFLPSNLPLLPSRPSSPPARPEPRPVSEPKVAPAVASVAHSFLVPCPPPSSRPPTLLQQWVSLSPDSVSQRPTQSLPSLGRVHCASLPVPTSR